MTDVKFTDVLLPVPENWNVAEFGGEYNELIRKSKFAERLQFDRSRVTQLVSDGVLSGEALVGPSGRKQQLRYGPAYIQFEQNRDALQVLINGKEPQPVTNETPDEPVGDLLTQPKAAPTEKPSQNNSKKDEYEDIRLAKARYELKRTAEDDRLRSGEYMRTRDVASLVGETLSEIFQAIEGDFQAWGQHLAVECVDADAVVYRNALRKLFSDLRVRLQKSQENLAQELPDIVEEDCYENSSSQSASVGGRSLGTSANATTTH